MSTSERTLVKPVPKSTCTKTFSVPLLSTGWQLVYCLSIYLVAQEQTQYHFLLSSLPWLLAGCQACVTEPNSLPFSACFREIAAFLSCAPGKIRRKVGWKMKWLATRLAHLWIWVWAVATTNVYRIQERYHRHFSHHWFYQWLRQRRSHISAFEVPTALQTVNQRSSITPWYYTLIL